MTREEGAELWLEFPTKIVQDGAGREMAKKKGVWSSGSKNQA
jgi:hypothetical protein